MSNNGLKVCAFCGVQITNKNISKEHIWPRWLREYIPIVDKKTVHAVSIDKYEIYSDGSRSDTIRGKVVPGKLSRPGDIFSQTLKIVCKSCNNGWMSSIVNEARPHLLPFIAGEWPQLNSEAVNRISAWACLFTMVSEFSDIPTMANGPIERKALMDTMMPSDNWAIYLGRHQGNMWRGAVNHFGLGGEVAITEEEFKALSHLKPWQSSQSTAFCLGSLFLLTYSNRIKPLKGTDFSNMAELRKVWPVSGRDVVPPIKILDDVDADQISRLFLSPVHKLTARPVWVSK